MKGFSTYVRISLLVWTVLASGSAGLAQQSTIPKRVLVLHWEDRENPANIRFDGYYQAALESVAPGGIEYFSEYLETNKFPGENQSQVLSDYLRQKYAHLRMDVVVAHSSPSLEFLFKRRKELFPDIPIVFATERTVAARVAKEADATGIVYANSYHDTVELALNLHPGTQRLFVISGNLSHDKAFESMAQDALEDYKDKVAITYFTDLPSEEMTRRLRDLPRQSLILYVWQQELNRQGKILGTQDVLARIVPEARAPIYGLSYANVGLGIVGGQVYTLEGNTTKLAALTWRVANGARAGDIPVENAPEVPMFDWRQLQRWGIQEDRLPRDSAIQFRERTVWQQYRWRIVAAIVAFVLQALLIGALLIERQRARRAQQRLKENEEHLEDLVQQRTVEMVEARDQALAANRAKTVFLANMSHELRTPLNSILGFSAIVRADASLSEGHREDLALVRSSGEHLLGLIDDVLDMAKIETGRTSAESTSLDLRALVNDTINMLRGKANAKNLELLLDISSRVPQYVRSDPGKLRQVLTNLIGNALKYTDEGSVVVRLDAKRDDNHQHFMLIFDVEDTGIGIAPEDQARIFDPFVQAGGTRTRKGTGLGLAISRHFVEILGGTISVESTLGQGSRFRVEVPAQPAVASEVMVETASVQQVIGLEPGQPDYRILIVEDQKENWLLLERLLQTAGFAVQVAEDGAQAVEAFEKWRPHFIWMDLRLPVFDGLEAARRIRRLEGGADVKIAAVTASAFASQREEVLAAGLDDFLRKPFRSGEIFDCLARHLGVRYVYGVESRPAGAGMPVILRPEDLMTLSTAVRDELEHAVISLDRDRIALLVRKVSQQNASLGSVLARLDSAFAYTPILQALESCKTTFTEAQA
jgi:signal transduction histidine kinase/DNA-binding response OmpR family regulator